MSSLRGPGGLANLGLELEVLDTRVHVGLEEQVYCFLVSCYVVFLCECVLIVIIVVYVGLEGQVGHGRSLIS